MTAILDPLPRNIKLRLAPNMADKVFTTGQVAKICKVAPRTVSKWFDTGTLKGYRIPGSEDRRIPASELFRFMVAHGMNPLIPGELIARGERVLYVWVPSEYPDAPNVEQFIRADTEFDAALWVNDRMNHAGACVIGTANGYTAAARLAARLKGIAPHLRAILMHTDNDIADMGGARAAEVCALVCVNSLAEFNAKVIKALEPLPVS